MELDSLSMLSGSLQMIAQNPQIPQALVNITSTDFPADLPFDITLISVMGIVAIFFVPFIAFVLIVWFNLNYRQKQNKIKAELITKAIENGQTIPDNLFKTKEDKSLLQKSVPWIAFGLGSMVFFILKPSVYLALALGLTLLLIGIGYLLIYFFNKKEIKENDSDK
jgi:Ca2+/Na+ antiporter